MSTPSTRTDRALVTRRRMVRAAYDLFCERGYLGTTISEVARQANVAVPTIYYTFGTKAVLLEEALGAAVLGFDRWREPPADPDMSELLPWHQWWADFEAATTSDEAFDIFFTHGVRILEVVEPEVRDHEVDRAGRQVQGSGVLLEHVDIRQPDLGDLPAQARERRRPGIDRVDGR